MFNISQYFFSQQIEEKNNVYKDAFLDILMKRRNKIFSIYGVINMHSINTKKKIDDIMNDKNDVLDAINQIKNNENIICYYYCKDDKIYCLFEYTITPTIRNIKNNNIDIAINDVIDGFFSSNIDIDTIKNVLLEPKKYFNFCPKKLNIGGQNIFKHLVQLNEEKTLSDLLNKYNIHITDTNIYTSSGCGIKYQDLLNIALSNNNSNIVNIINTNYYENIKNNGIFIREFEEYINPDSNNTYQIFYKKYGFHIDVISKISATLTFPLLFFITFFGYSC
jgi:hypothetical protein